MREENRPGFEALASELNGLEVSNRISRSICKSKSICTAVSMSISISTSYLHAREATAEAQIPSARSLAGQTPGGQTRRHSLDDQDFLCLQHLSHDIF